MRASPSLRRIAVIGAGRAGRDFTLRCLRAGLHVTLEDVMPSRLLRAKQDHAGTLDPVTSGELHLASTIEEAVREADLAIDFVPDELESKLEIFSLLDRMAPPHTLFCTPIQELSISDLASCTYRPQLCFALQINTAEQSSPAARLIRTICSEPAAISAIELWLRSIGFTVSLELDRAETMLVSRAANSPRRKES
jgi:3-hydroxybutyryl-CoA dehydrogenase